MTVITPSHWLAGLVRQSFLGKYPVQVIHNGIDLDVFKPTPSSWKEDLGITKPIVLACASVWGKSKGYNDLLKLGELLHDYQIVIIGVSIKQSKSLPKKIIGITRTESIKELVKIYSAADVFINTTYQDTFPTVNLEALACGTPVITYDTGGSKESVNEKCGTVVAKGDVYSLIESVKERLNNRQISKEKCNSQSKYFNINLKYQEYYQLFQNQR
jgi:glycosyltransferase involved in cell wall biosynthesis